MFSALAKFVLGCAGVFHFISIFIEIFIPIVNSVLLGDFNNKMYLQGRWKVVKLKPTDVIKQSTVDMSPCILWGTESCPSAKFKSFRQVRNFKTNFMRTLIVCCPSYGCRIVP